MLLLLQYFIGGGGSLQFITVIHGGGALRWRDVCQAHFRKNLMSTMHENNMRAGSKSCIKGCAWYKDTCIELQSKRRPFPKNRHCLIGANFVWGKKYCTLCNRTRYFKSNIEIGMIFYIFGPIWVLWCFLKVLASCYLTLADRAESHCLPTQACSTQSTAHSFLKTRNGTAARPCFCAVEIQV